MSSIFSKIFDSNERQIKKMMPIVETINSFEELDKNLSDSDLKEKTAKFKEALRNRSESEEQEILEDILPEAYALVKEAVRRTLGFRAHDVQLFAAIVLHQGKIAEQKTGEGKTLTAVFPLYLNSLSGRGCHLVTPNDYLSKIGCGWMGPIYHLLGVSVATIVHEQAFTYDPVYEDKTALDSRLLHLRPISRIEGYQSDITYGTNNEFGFDYLRDNMVWQFEQMVQTNPKKDWGAHHFAIVDEVDFILVDEARTPLIISAPAEESTDKYYDYARMIKKLEKEKDYTTDEKAKNAVLTEEGIAKLESWLHVDNLYEKDFDTLHRIEQSLKANTMYHRDRDYIVKEGEVIIVDEFTGRLMQGRRYSEGLHQAIEAKEGVKIKKESKTLATISFQNYFRMYQKLSGMTGTAVTEAEEFYKIYMLDVVVIPTDKKVVRKDQADLIYKNEQVKYEAVIAEIKEKNVTGQPILIGTTSISKNEYLSDLLKRNGVKHALLNAKHHEREALILAQAGEKGAVTVATNMAGRGVDIELGGRKPDFYQVDRKDAKAVTEFEKELSIWQKNHEEVVSLGGLYVIGTERHEARRIDNQLRGRSGRQGDPGLSRFYVSLEDDLMRIFGGEQVKRIMTLFKIPDDLPLEHQMVSKALQSAQTRVEGHNFDIRKQLVEYDDVMNKQREIIYQRRRQILEEARSKPGETEGVLKDRILNMVTNEIQQLVQSGMDEQGFNFSQIVAEFATIIPFNTESRTQIETEIKTLTSLDEISNKLVEIAKQAYAHKEKELGTENIRSIERFVSLSTIDNLWQLHLTDMDTMRTGIGLRGYGQRDPLVEYKGEAYKMFELLNNAIDHEIADRIYKVGIARKEAIQPQMMAVKPEVEDIAKSVGSKEVAPISRVKATEVHRTPIQADQKVGRNDPCPCGSGKKYKKCHGK